MATTTITVQVRNVYGNSVVYPICERAKRFAAIARQRDAHPSGAL